MKDLEMSFKLYKIEDMQDLATYANFTLSSETVPFNGLRLAHIVSILNAEKFNKIQISVKEKGFEIEEINKNITGNFDLMRVKHILDDCPDNLDFSSLSDIESGFLKHSIQNLKRRFYWFLKKQIPPFPQYCVGQNFDQEACVKDIAKAIRNIINDHIKNDVYQKFKFSVRVRTTKRKPIITLTINEFSSPVLNHEYVKAMSLHPDHPHLWPQQRYSDEFNDFYSHLNSLMTSFHEYYKNGATEFYHACFHGVIKIDKKQEAREFNLCKITKS